MTELFTPDGKPAFGVYEGQLGALPIGRYATPGVPKLLRPLRIKRWRFVGLYAPNLTVGLAVVHTGYLGSSFFFVYDHQEKRLYEAEGTSPFALGTTISDHARKGEAVFRGRKLHASIRYDDETQIEVKAETPKGEVSLSARIDERLSTLTPHQTITPTPTPGRFTCTHKAAGMPAWGELRLAGKAIPLARETTFAVTDHTVGVHDAHWEWRWACFGGLAKNGQRVGLNLVEPVFDPVNQENALWIDGRHYPVSAARFSLNPKAPLEPWHMVSEDGQVDLHFVPIGERAKTLNVGLLLSAYRQPFGHFSGLLRPAGGPSLEIEGLSGVVELHEARW